jgi:hypothetical protein
MRGTVRMRMMIVIVVMRMVRLLGRRMKTIRVPSFMTEPEVFTVTVEVSALNK